MNQNRTEEGREPEPAAKPSQAEGERDMSAAPSDSDMSGAPAKPSQAEGDPETIDADIRQKEAEGEL